MTSVASERMLAAAKLHRSSEAPPQLFSSAGRGGDDLGELIKQWKSNDVYVSGFYFRFIRDTFTHFADTHGSKNRFSEKWSKFL